MLAADAAAFAAICAFVDFDSLGTALGISVMTVPAVAAIALLVWGIQETMAAPRFRLPLGRDGGAEAEKVVQHFRERPERPASGGVPAPGR